MGLDYGKRPLIMDETEYVKHKEEKIKTRANWFKIQQER